MSFPLAPLPPSIVMPSWCLDLRAAFLDFLQWAIIEELENHRSAEGQRGSAVGWKWVCFSVALAETVLSVGTRVDTSRHEHIWDCRHACNNTYTHTHAHTHNVNIVYVCLKICTHPTYVHMYAQIDIKHAQFKMHRGARRAKGHQHTQYKEQHLKGRRLLPRYRTGAPVAWQGREMNLECCYT